MTRRIVRTGIQLGVLTFLVLLFIFILDNRFRVLPNKIHGYLPIHHEGLVLIDVTVTTCSLISSCSLDSDKWHRVEKDLYLDQGWFSHAYVYVQRKREEDLLDTDRVVFDLRIGRLDPTVSEKDQGAQRWESRNAGIWLLRSSKRHASDSEKAITAVDVLFGADAVEPRTGWEIKDQALLLSASPDIPEPRLSIRRGTPKSLAKPIPRVRKDGKFKILQVSDLHFSTGLGVCRDPEPPSPGGSCDADPRTLEFVGSVLDAERPDIVVLSGDQVNGETAPDAQSAVFKFAEVFVKRNIPYALIFGNHDDEGSLDRAALMSLTQSLPLSLSEPGPATVDGVGNYVVEVLARGTSSHSAITLYLFDTHGYSPDETHFKGYDWLKKSQLDWLRETAGSLRNSAAHKDYAHIHLNMAFVHIPLPEYRNAGNLVPGSGKRLETPTAPGFNSGAKDAFVENSIFAVSCGHDHANDYCTVEPHSDPKKAMNRMWMCYGGGAGFGGYGGYGGYRRRVRVWDFDMNEARVETWVRIEGEDSGRVNAKVVVEEGKVLEG
ncbi:hypothetical protein MMC13_007149 [Lambiella insularis]|nr:hypothetical protein [Lambiella insularis]